MEEYEYFLLLAGCFSSVALAAWCYGVWKNAWRYWQAFALAIGITFIFFSVWDYFAISREHWWFNGKYVTGLRVHNIPIEELTFFVIIPLACLLTWEILCSVLNKKK